MSSSALGGAGVSSDLARDLEGIEGRAWADFFRSAPIEVARGCGLDLHVEGLVVICVAAKLDIVGLNRVIGLGLREPATPAALEASLRVYERASPARYAVQLSPAALPRELESWLQGRGFVHHNNWVKLQARVDRLALRRPESHLVVRRIEHSDAATFGRIVVAAFDWPVELVPWVAATVGRPRWHHYLAYTDGEPIATGAIYIEDDLAWLDFAATLPSQRGRGAQTALLARRMEMSAKLGARLLTIEAAEDRPDKRSSSLHNALRLGFEAAYLRPNYLRSDRPTAR